MKKRAVLFLTVMSMLVLAGCNQPAKNTPVVGVVDMTRVYEESTAAKAGQEYLENLAADARKEFEGMQAEMQNAQGNEEATQKMHASITDLRNRINAAQQRVMVALDENLKSVMQKYRAEKGYAILMHKEGVISYDDSVDVTSDIISEMNKLSVTFEETNSTGDAPAPDTK
ncbi:OmpH family outer membrane protein [Oleidesulfovibrio alaskensis]|jgi:outer membrane protein|uniref:OmpH family outer membrane protein n=1 Tax=Oleidesulfovibrio alaskensis TaxID=58180 RepID=UPI001A38CECD|nr:OmpH family outer membrane protein [Oleidesulfovibrio alaskensis]MBL3581600.1 OmpH family outer membrane protein [Oleidesulfovibrio alaskensis]MBL3588079.1 OmpH family outer membrane protein [bacterium]